MFCGFRGKDFSTVYLLGSKKLAAFFKGCSLGNTRVSVVLLPRDIGSGGCSACFK